jgi:hypothetical protein
LTVTKNARFPERRDPDVALTVYTVPQLADLVELVGPRRSVSARKPRSLFARFRPVDTQRSPAVVDVVLDVCLVDVPYCAVGLV